MRSSLAIRIIVLMVMSITPLSAILFYNLYNLQLSQERAVHDKAYRLGQVAALEMARIVGGAEDTLLSIAAAPAVRDFDAASCNAYMARVTQSLPQFSGIAVLDRDGVIRCLQNPSGIGVSLRDTTYFQESFRDGKTVIGRYTRGRVSNALVLPIAVPVRNDAGRTTGVVAGSLSLHWLQQRLTERNFARSSSLTIADADGTVLARYPSPDQFVGTRIPDAFQSLVRAVAPGTTEVTSQDGVKRVLAYFPPSDPTTGLYLSIGLSTEEEYGAISTALTWGWVAALATISIAAALAWFAGSHAIKKPIENLVSTVEAWRQGHLEARTNLAKTDGEFGIVGAAIDAYMNELVEARARSEILMRELDHRVKNLLSTVQVVTRQSLKSANVDPAVLAVLNARLAAMAKAHSVLMTNEHHTARFDLLVEAALEPFRVKGADSFEIAGPGLTVGSTAALAFSMALHELATNAAKYGALSADGCVDVHWNFEDDGQTLRFSWSETGGPALVEPESKGFGSVMIQKMLGEQLSGHLVVSYPPQGLQLIFTVPRNHLVT